MPVPGDVGPLSEEEWAIWRGFLAWGQRVRNQVAAEITARSPMTFSDFEVLVRVDSGGGAARQQDLQNSLQWSPSRLSHQLRRMGERDLVHREEAGRGRAVVVRLTPAGQSAITDALQIQGTSVRRALLDTLEQPLREFLAQQHPGNPRSLN